MAKVLIKRKIGVLCNEKHTDRINNTKNRKIVTHIIICIIIANIQSCGTSSKRGEHMYLDFHSENDEENCMCKLILLFSGSLKISIIFMPNSQSFISVMTEYRHRDNATLINFKNSPYAHIVKIGDLLYIKPYYVIKKRSYFCLLVSSEGLALSYY